jgi:Chalcone isomerase-like
VKLRGRTTLLALLLGAIVCACGFTAAWAKQNKGVPPAQISSLADVRSHGVARLKIFGFDIYDARLWVAPDFKDADYTRHEFALEINYLRKFDNDALAKRSIKEMAGIGAMTPEQSEQWLAQMRKIFPDIAKGDHLVGVHKPGEGAVFTFNGKPAGEIRDPEFARLFFGIWLSPQTSQPQMRRELLGLHNAGKP